MLLCLNMCPPQALIPVPRSWAQECLNLVPQRVYIVGFALPDNKLSHPAAHKLACASASHWTLRCSLGDQHPVLLPGVRPSPCLMLPETAMNPDGLPADLEDKVRFAGPHAHVWCYQQ